MVPTRERLAQQPSLSISGEGSPRRRVGRDPDSPAFTIPEAANLSRPAKSPPSSVAIRTAIRAPRPTPDGNRSSARRTPEYRPATRACRPRWLTRSRTTSAAACRSRRNVVSGEERVYRRAEDLVDEVIEARMLLAALRSATRMARRSGGRSPDRSGVCGSGTNADCHARRSRRLLSARATPVPTNRSVAGSGTGSAKV